MLSHQIEEKERRKEQEKKYKENYDSQLARIMEHMNN